MTPEGDGEVVGRLDLGADPNLRSTPVSAPAPWIRVASVAFIVVNSGLRCLLSILYQAIHKIYRDKNRFASYW